MGLLDLDLGLKGLLKEKEKEVIIQLTKKQQEVISSTSSRIIVSGGFGSGKTFLGAVWLKKQLEEHQNTVAIIVSPSLPTLRRNVFPALWAVGIEETQLDMASSFSYKGSRVYCLGLDNISSIKRVRGMSSGIFWANEATFLLEEAFNEAISRVRMSPNQVFVETNPDDPQHWVYSRIVTNPSFLHYSFSTFDNTNLGIDVKKYVSDNILAKENTNFYRRMVLGEWIEGDDLLFQNMRLTLPVGGLWDFCVIDPSLEGGDFTAMSCFIKNGKGWVVKGLTSKMKFDDFLELSRVQDELLRSNKAYLEANVIGSRGVTALKPFVTKAYAIRSTSNKVSRIVKCGFPINTGMILFDNSSDKDYISKVQAWSLKKGKDQVDDQIDSLAIGLEHRGVL